MLPIPIAAATVTRSKLLITGQSVAISTITELARAKMNFKSLYVIESNLEMHALPKVYFNIYVVLCFGYVLYIPVV